MVTANIFTYCVWLSSRGAVTNKYDYLVMRWLIILDGTSQWHLWALQQLVQGSPLLRAHTGFVFPRGKANQEHHTQF